ncbi:MAG: hypothetical protein ACK2UT_10940 [Candidatus Promineifilaceae bacterium]
MISKKRRNLVFILLALLLVTGTVLVASAWTPVAVVDDPLVRMPGTQPGQVTLESPTRCLNCHEGYDTAVEPGFNWKGSMMAHSAHDFLFWSCMTVAAQDSIWAVGTPNATDICERCHFPEGWLEGRSDPSNASLMTGSDYDGVQCDFCHQLYDPFFEATHSGVREGSDWLNYWDETNNSGTPSQVAADETYAADTLLAQEILRFNGSAFYSSSLPPASYTENGSGQYFVSPDGQKRASFADANGRHPMLYSRYHKSKYMCETCHDVSNPVLANLGADPSQPLPTEVNPASSYFHVERTFSEFMLSAYGQQGGAPTNADFQSQGAPNITVAAKCQDCHMRDVRGAAADMRNAVVRPDQSIEHPNSGVPLHDLTGGNVWVSTVLASAVPGSANYDAQNENWLKQGPSVLTLDLTQGAGLDSAALLAGADRARQQLLLAATVKNITYDQASGALAFQVQNNTGHKLISGFPEGRRMFVNIKAYAGGSLVYEVNPYDAAAGTLKGLAYPYLGQGLPDPQPLAANEVYADDLVYEMHPESALTGEDNSFHFALATGRHKDNRIPPKGFDIANAAARLSQPVYYVDGVDVGADFFTQAEYEGGFDDVSLTIPSSADYVEVNVFYQTTSREYIEFLRDEINGSGNLTLTGTGAGGDAAYLVQSDPFFSQLTGWGDTLWNLWTHNMNVDGAAPFLMAQATSDAPTACGVTAPTLESAVPGNGEVVLSWSEDTGATGYNVYYDQAGKAQFVADAGNSTTYTNTGLTNGVEYCYMVTAYDATCESGYSNVLCATPQNQGQTTDPAGVSTMDTGLWTGKGNNKLFTPTDTFTTGDSVVIRARVTDANGNPVPNATVEVTIGGPETTTLNSNPSDADGWAEATWNTQAPNKKGQGGTTIGAYTASTTNVTASGYHWDGVTTQASFTIQ